MKNCFLNQRFVKSFEIRYFLLVFLFLFASFSFAQGSTAASPSSDRQFVIVLDAGHGGHDPGNSGNGYIEKDIALNVVMKVGKILEKKSNIKVLYTRKTDVFITLKGRAEKANKNKADLFVSVHCNSFGKSAKPHGTETYVFGIRRNADNFEVAKKENSVIYLEDDYKATYKGFDPEDPGSFIGLSLMQEAYLDQSILLADYIQKRYTNSLKRFDRGVKRDVFLVLRETYMPSVLTEIGFLTNRAEGKYLNTKHGQSEIASALADGILKYINTLNLDAIDVVNVDLQDLVDKKEKEESDIVFRVQIAAGSKPLQTEPYNFNGLKHIQRKKEDDMYKYYYGKTSDYLKIQDMQRHAQDKGFAASYIVAFKKGKKITVQEALKNRAE